MVHYSKDAVVMQGLPTEIAKYDITEGTKMDKTEKCSFTMRVSNNIHNIACLDEAEFVQEWTEEEKIPIKTKRTPTVTPPPEDKKEDSKEGKKEGEPEPEKP
jgi:predicted lipoprotein